MHRFLLAAAIVLIGLSASVRAQRLPIKMYTVADGVADNRIHRIVRDSRGFIWFCTSDGLSRFDGHNFITFNGDSGLPFPSINDLLETRNHDYYVATNGGGVIFFNPGYGADRSQQQSRFVVHRVGDKAVTNRVNHLYEDKLGRIWAGTDGGVFVMEAAKGERDFRPLSLGLASQPDEAVQVWTFLEDSDGSLWIGTKFGLLRRLPDGRMLHYAVQPSEGTDVVFKLLDDKAGRIWMGHKAGLIVFKPGDPLTETAGSRTEESTSTLRSINLKSVPSDRGNQIHLPERPGEARLSVPGNGQNGTRIISLCRSRDGSIWIGSTTGVMQFSGEGLQSHTTGNETISLTEDGEGSIWVATNNNGAARIYRNGFALYGEPDGLDPSMRSMLETKSGDRYIASGNFYISRIERDKFVTSRPNIPKSAGWRSNPVVLRDHTGEWWFATTQGLFRFPHVNSIEQLANAKSITYSVKDGLAGNDLTSIYEDTHGDLWIGNFAPGHESLTRWDRAADEFQRYSSDDGLPPFNAPTSFCEDRAGNLWIGFFGDGLTRYRGGHFTTFTAKDGFPVGGCRDIHLDHLGRLWVVSSNGGLIRIDEPDAQYPKIAVYTVADGLSSNNTSHVTEDEKGRIYVTTARTIDRLEPDTGRIKRFPVFEQLGISEFTFAFHDSRDVLWFGTTHGLARLLSEPDSTLTPAPVFIDGLRFSGVPRSISVLGESDISGLEVGPDKNHVQIDFFALGFGSGGALRYQYRLDGIDDWNPPSANRTVTYAGLAPGTYRFLVRAIAADGTQSETPASVGFRILSPFWRRWWFIAILGLVGASAALIFTQSRVKRLKTLRESENRFRTLAQTASDAIITIDESSTIVFVNLAAERVFGYKREELLGSPLTNLMPEYLRHLHKAGLARYHQTGSRHIAWVGTELPGLHKQGHEIPLEISFGEFERNGHRFFTGIARDITERKRAEAERKQAEDALRRSREERLAELERVRYRIATDLHDDVGSSLTRISLLSEVVQRKVVDSDAPVSEPLSAIARLSRELVDSMSDIVWAINPNKDHLSDLTQRMRHFASDVFSARQIDFILRTPATEKDFRMGANFRRELFLVFKEAVNNIARHSGCTRAEIEFRVDDAKLVLRLSDNGRGFDLSRESEGHGLKSMLGRTEGLGGSIEISSRPGEGTTLTFRIPLRENEPALTAAEG